jgi:hypothetical protein
MCSSTEPLNLAIGVFSGTPVAAATLDASPSATMTARPSTG